jgi:hypothetical protein
MAIPAWTRFLRSNAQLESSTPERGVRENPAGAGFTDRMGARRVLAARAGAGTQPRIRRPGQ